jgi:hypothetical protein
MMKGQAQRSGLVMGFDTHMIAGAVPALRPARPTQPNITNRSDPHYDETLDGALLYFSSGPDIYLSQRLPDGGFGPASAVTELNSAAADLRPNVRKDGLEIVFDSNRPGTLGGFDLYAATRASVDDPWSAPVNLGAVVNTANNETRPSLSWDAKTLYFGRAPGPEGSTDIYISTRNRLTGRG